MQRLELHSRNVFRIKPPIFKDLAEKYPDFRRNCYIGRGGKVSIDFKNLEAISTLSKVLLLEYFGLDVELPTLVPRIPQRMNYILLIEDLLNANNISNNIMGIDIGTGSSCIFALLGAKINNWTVFGTEIDETSMVIAKENVKRNLLEDKIHLVYSKQGTIFENIFECSTEQFSFCMCNPPFFDVEEGEKRFLYNNPDNLIQNHFLKDLMGNRSAPTSATIASANEMFYEGGEVGFIGKIVQESLIYKKQIRIFTSMIGKRNSIAPLKMLLSGLQDVQFNVYKLSQGKTQRWVIAWTFDGLISLPNF